MYAGTTGRIVAGRYVLELGDAGGALVREASPCERPHVRPRPTPVLLRPRSIRGLIGRHAELASALSGLDARLAVEITGEPGIGKTALLRSLAHDPRTSVAQGVRTSVAQGSQTSVAQGFSPVSDDGIIYLYARHLSPLDLQQLIFDAFYESNDSFKPIDADIRRGLHGRHALIVLDDVRLTESEIQTVMDAAPGCSFLLSTRERCLWGEARNIALKGLPEEDAMALLEREIERPLDGALRTAAANICAALGGHPRRLLQAAAIIRENGLPSAGWLESVTPEHLLADLLPSVDDTQRRVLLALAALPGVALHARHIAGIADVNDIEPSLIALVRRGLVTTNHSRHQLAHGVSDRLRRMEDLKPWANRAVTYWTSWAERHRRNIDALIDECDALIRVHQSASDNRRSEEVLALGRLLEAPLVLRARWGAWALVVERCLDTARATGDRSTEAWALHELGTRALCLGDAGTARVMLTQAVKLRHELDERSAAAVSEQNLDVILPPAPESLREIEMAPAVLPTFDLDSISLRDAPDAAEADAAPETTSVVPALYLAMLLAISGAFGYWAFHAVRSWQSSDVERTVSVIRREFSESMDRWRGMFGSKPAAESTMAESPAGEPQEATVVDLEDAEPPRGSSEPAPAPAILIFSPRPSSITRGGPTNLCYAVSDASQVRVEPGVGDVTPTRSLNCVRVAPSRTTTYELTAYGSGGQQVKQQLVIFVR